MAFSLCKSIQVSWKILLIIFSEMTGYMCGLERTCEYQNEGDTEHGVQSELQRKKQEGTDSSNRGAYREEGSLHEGSFLCI